MFSPALRWIGLIQGCPGFCAKPPSITTPATVRNSRSAACRRMHEAGYRSWLQLVAIGLNSSARQQSGGSLPCTAVLVERPLCLIPKAAVGRAVTRDFLSSRLDRRPDPRAGELEVSTNMLPDRLRIQLLRSTNHEALKQGGDAHEHGPSLRGIGMQSGQRDRRLPACPVRRAGDFPRRPIGVLAVGPQQDV